MLGSVHSPRGGNVVYRAGTKEAGEVVRVRRSKKRVAAKTDGGFDKASTSSKSGSLRHQQSVCQKYNVDFTSLNTIVGLELDQCQTTGMRTTLRIPKFPTQLIPAMATNVLDQQSGRVVRQG